MDIFRIIDRPALCQATGDCTMDTRCHCYWADHQNEELWFTAVVGRTVYSFPGRALIEEDAAPKWVREYFYKLDTPKLCWSCHGRRYTCASCTRGVAACECYPSFPRPCVQCNPYGVFEWRE